ATGRFTSVDPVMDLTDPTQWNAYSYAQNSPITLSDPDGNRPLGAGDWGCMNCRQTTTKAKNGKTKKSWTFGNENVSKDPWTKKASYDTNGGPGYRSVWGKKYKGTKYTGGGSHWTEKPRRQAPMTWWQKGIVGAALMSPGASILGFADAIKAAFKGDYGDAAIGAVTSLPFGKFFKGGKLVDEGVDAAKTGGDVLRPLSRIEASTLDDALRPAKLDHVFVPKHNFDPLVTRYGSREDAMEQIVRGLSGPDLPSAGRFEVNRVVGGQDVVIRGAVVDGTPRIGTAFTP
ncbi:MAG: hypothetical protein ACRC0L_11685, partial [Angustibacter sp.]